MNIIQTTKKYITLPRCSQITMEDINNMIKNLAAQNGPPVAPGRSTGGNNFNSETIELTMKQSAWLVSSGASFKDAHIGAIVKRKDFDAWVKYKRDFIAATGSSEEGPISGTHAYSFNVSFHNITYKALLQTKMNNLKLSSHLLSYG